MTLVDQSMVSDVISPRVDGLTRCLFFDSRVGLFYVRLVSHDIMDHILNHGFAFGLFFKKKMKVHWSRCLEFINLTICTLFVDRKIYLIISRYYRK